MRVVTNDLILNDMFSNKYDAIRAIRDGICILKKLSEVTNFSRLYSSRNIFRGLELAPGYCMEQVFSENNEVIPYIEKQLLRTLLLNFHTIETTEERFVFEDRSSVQCAWAYRRQAFLFSLLIDSKYAAETFKGKLVDKEKQKMNIELDNISKMEHIEIHKRKLGIRKYEFNPKHKINIGWGTEMDLSDEEAQGLLAKALPVDKEEKHLVAKKGERYYSFRCHYDNCYHGYWDNSMLEHIRMIADRVE